MIYVFCLNSASDGPLDTMNPLPGQGGKKRTKLEKILRQDHSDIYFDNERLNDELNNRIDSLNKELHRSEMMREIEIGKLRREIDELRALRTTKAEEQLQQINTRPHTTGQITRQRTGRRGTLSAKGAPRTPWNDKPVEAKKTVPVEKAILPVDIETQSAHRNRRRKFREFRNVKGIHFKENNKFPQEWYSRSIPASDAAIQQNRRIGKTRGKSAPPKPTYEFLDKLREIERSVSKFDSVRPRTKFARPLSAMGGDELDGSRLLCDKPVKPIVMSLRRLKEITHIDNIADRTRGPSRNTQRKQNIIDINIMENRRIDAKVLQFCKDLEDLKEREAAMEKEKEEMRRREAQEKLLLMDFATEVM